MTTPRGLVRIVGLIVLVGIGLFPPWRLSITDATTQTAETRSAGYHPLWNPPAEPVEAPSEKSDVRYQVDLVRLGIQLAGAVLLVNVALLALKKKD